MYVHNKKEINLSQIPLEKRSKELCYLAMNIDANNIKYVPDRFKTQEMCIKAVSKDVNNIRYVPTELQVQEMWNLVVLKDVSNIIDVPEKFLTQEMCNLVMSKNINNIIYIPVQYQKQEMFELAVSKNANNIRYVPDGFKTQEMCKFAVSKNANNIRYVPKKFLTQEMCKFVVSKNANNIRYVPKKFLTREIRNLIIFRIQNLRDEFKTQKLCDEAVSKYPGNIKYVPDRFKTQEMCIKVLKIDVYIYSKLIPKNMWNETVLAVVKNELNKLIQSKKTIPADSELCNYLIDLFPELTLLLGKEKSNKIIIEEIKKILINKGSIESIAEKYGITTNVVNGILKQLKETDLELYEKIKKHLDNNQRKFWFARLADIEKVVQIIRSLGDLNDKRLSPEQKIKFSYLYGKYVNIPLEEMYEFDYDKYSPEYASTLSYFFEKYLKFDILLDENTIRMDAREIEFNNSWLSNYSSNRYWGVKEGVPTMTHNYAGKEMTKEAERHVINELRMQQIPLKQFIVEQAFRHYAKGTLNEYIRTLQSYEDTMNKPKEK